MNQKAGRSGKSREAFIRAAIAGCEVKAPPPVDFNRYYREARRIGSNIDQIRRTAQGKKFIDVPLLERSIKELYRLETEVWNAVMRRNE